MAETQPGGLYKVGDELVNAKGEPVKAKASSKPADPPPDPDAVGDDFPGAKALREAGLTSKKAVGEKTDEELKAINGIGDKTIGEIRDALKA